MGRVADTWWMILIRGICAIVFGLFALVWPGITVFALVIFFGAYAIVNGIFSLFGAFGGTPGESRWWLAIAGVLGIVAGIIALVWPGITALALLMLIAIWAVVIGIIEIIAGIRLRKEIQGEWMFILSGVLAVVFGVLLFVWPATGALAVTWLIGAMALVYGISLLVLAFRVRKLGGRTAGRHAPGMPGGTAVV
ncbi:HdeD family acid-resistance protein [Streptosporangium sp. KLBMP 9127]|nr:HdeD family acid-resistance protein [Streptosporangium sp. KLBMP 9127]